MFKFPKIKTDTKQNIIIATLALLLLLSNFSLVAQFLGRLNPLASYQQKIEKAERRAVILEFDRVRLEDISNIILALQDYQFTNRAFPETLEILKEKGYLDPNARLADPGTSQPYFYQKRPQGDFVLCAWLSDMVKGVNTAQCPSDLAEAATDKTSAPAPADEKPEAQSSMQAKEQKLEIIGEAPYVNVREQPTTNSAVVARVVPGEEYVFTETKEDWYHIIVNDSKEGWVRNDYASPVSAE